MSKRSHQGCSRCKGRRQKCDEARPSCTRCHEAGEQCQYLVVLKWDGRTPRVDGNSKRRKLNVTTLQPWNWNATEGLLMHHYINHTSNIIGHRYIRDQTCRDLVPLANERPALRFAIMAISAMHRMTLLEDFTSYNLDASVSRLIANSLQHLRQDLYGPGDESVLQAIKTLCICEIYSGRADSAWRTHFMGATAVLRAHHPSKLITQWYESMEALTSLTDQGQSSRNLQYIEVRDDVILDMYTGYTPDLNDVFRQIGFARSLQGQELEEQASMLEEAVQSMIYRDNQALKFPPDVELTKEEARQFAACNFAYQQSALIHIYRKLHRIHPASAEVQTCVSTILTTLQNIMPMNALSPWALLTTPIFTAG